MAKFISTASAYVSRLFHTPNQRVVIAGMDSCGKTTLLYRLKANKFAVTIPTIGFNVETIQRQGVDFTLLDIGGGCSSLARMTHIYFYPESIVVFLIDASDTERMDYSILELKILLDGHYDIQHMVIVFTKLDLAEATTNFPDLVKRTKAVVSSYKTLGFQCEVYDDLNRFSAATGAQMDILMKRLVSIANKVPTNVMKEPAQKASEPPKGHSPYEEFRKRATEESKHVDQKLSADEFMARMIVGKLTDWSHYPHIRAGFITLCDCLLKESVVFEATDIFLEKLEKMLKASPGRFRNTVHRTMTTFWLHRIYMAMLLDMQDRGSLPSRDEFHGFVLRHLDLMDGRSWERHYTKDLLFSPSARDNWRLPDRDPLAQTIIDIPQKEEKESKRPPSSAKPNKNSEILKRFAYATLKTAKTANRRRAAVINETFPLIQSQIMRLRAESPGAAEPYSETQAYFWIQILHAAVQSLPPDYGLDISRLSYESFKLLFPNLLAADDAWKGYYSPEQWDSIEARMSTILPKLNPLPSIFQAPDKTCMDEAITSTLDEKYASKGNRSAPDGQPSMEDIFLQVRLAVKATSLSIYSNTNPPDTHEGLIRHIFNQIIAVHPEPLVARKSLSIVAWDAVQFLVDDLQVTHAVFWSRMVLSAFYTMEASFHEKAAQFQTMEPGSVAAEKMQNELFPLFLTASPELIWDGLWKSYYSDVAWKSEDAGKMYLLPDLRQIPYVEGRKESSWM
ncbi:hypothetical protein AJ80_07482 [Polytolypa hystricis UAMH7299]|uniref:Uncharacterized protein n=1 Tax=Polytolypa hystricis (strain UAMH7299) TaxID=1447883 RepID=A0A2B7XPU3_POLH7|nr:hypothetical protein AJ80_07482 [Polytolypa hystricis UAMH7299]